MMRQLYWLCMVKEIVSLLILHGLTLYAGVLYMQPGWYSFSYWPHIDIIPLGHLVIWLCFIYNRDIFGIKTHGSGSRGQKRAKRSPKNKTCAQQATVCLLHE